MFQSFTSIHAGTPFNDWTTLSYETSSECFYSGIKQVYTPFPGFGSIACVKKSITLLPDLEKSGNLLAGHAIGLLAIGLTSTIGLIIAAHLGIPSAKSILGPELTRFFCKDTSINSCKNY